MTQEAESLRLKISLTEFVPSSLTKRHAISHGEAISVTAEKLAQLLADFDVSLRSSGDSVIALLRLKRAQ